jgi:hypothetical protein
MRILVRSGAFALVIALSYGIAWLLPDPREEIAGLVAIATVTIGAFFWARQDARHIPQSDALRDWLVITAVVAVFWWVTLALFEGADDIGAQLRLDFLSVLSTAIVIFGTSVVGLVVGRGSRG